MPAYQAAQPVQPTIVIVGTREAAQHTPNTHETVDAAELRRTVNLRNTEDSLRYLPSLFVRKRHIGDTQAPLATRTSGVGSSARSLVYADGVLLSALIGNNNSFASPRWGMVAPEEIDHVDVLYGPFSAQYPGNAIGAVVNITTRMPDKLEASATAATNLQSFSQYGRRGHHPAYQLAGTIGARSGPLSWFLAANHVNSHGQPLSFISVSHPSTVTGGGAPVAGAIAGVNRTGSPIDIVGAGAIEHQKQDNLKAKVQLNLPADLKLSFQTGLFLNKTDAHAQTYLRDGSGAPVYAGTVNIDGRRVSIPVSAFSNQVYRFEERHWMHSARLEQDKGNSFWSLIGSVYNYGKDEQRIPGTALPGAASGGPGSIVRLNGTGWRTLDFHAFARSRGMQEFHAGAHYDEFTLRNDRFATSDWRVGQAGALLQSSRGHSRTLALWAEDHFGLTPELMLTVGSRYEWWKAFGGRNFSASPAADVVQPVRTKSGLSPKASLRWEPASRWSVTLSGGRAFRFPTVSELYQQVSTGPTITIPDPNLKPEKATSAELAIERTLRGGKLRLSLFHETIRDALLSQSGQLPGKTQLFSFVQNVARTRTNGAELAVEKRDLLPRVDLSASFTLADPKIASDPGFPAAEGKLIPQVARRRATMVATWRPTDRLSLTGATRYSSRLYGTIDNSDRVGHTFTGFEGFFVADARASYQLTPRLTFAAGVENMFDRRYFLYHPFPGRTFTAELHWGLK